MLTLVDFQGSGKHMEKLSSDLSTNFCLCASLNFLCIKINKRSGLCKVSHIRRKVTINISHHQDQSSWYWRHYNQTASCSPRIFIVFVWQPVGSILQWWYSLLRVYILNIYDWISWVWLEFTRNSSSWRGHPSKGFIRSNWRRYHDANI